MKYTSLSNDFSPRVLGLYERLLYVRLHWEAVFQRFVVRCDLSSKPSGWSDSTSDRFRESRLGGWRIRKIMEHGFLRQRVSGQQQQIITWLIFCHWILYLTVFGGAGFNPRASHTLGSVFYWAIPLVPLNPFACLASWLIHSATATDELTFPISCTFKRV